MTNVCIPAGILNQFEAFGHQQKTFSINEGRVLKPSQFPIHIDQLMFDEYKHDKPAHASLRRMNIPGVRSGFEQYKFCKYGGFDTTPDYNPNTKQLTPDYFNNACTSTTCQERGKLCGVASAISCDDYNTLKTVTAGFSTKAAAHHLHLSYTGMKSRIEKLKRKLNATNVTELSARAAQLGITASANA